MCLAGACGLWDTGFGAGVDPPRAVMHGLSSVELRTFLAQAARTCTIVGAEITSAAPGHGELVVGVIALLLA